MSLHYFNTVYMEFFENYKRHSFRNRAKILGANGTLLLTVPIKKKTQKL